MNAELKEALAEWDRLSADKDARLSYPLLEIVEAARRVAEADEGIVMGAMDGPRYDSHHPMNAPWGAYVDLSMMGNKAPEVGKRYYLVPVEGRLLLPVEEETHDGECDCVQCELAREGQA